MPADVTPDFPAKLMRHQEANGRSRVVVFNAETGEQIITFWEQQSGKPMGRPKGGRNVTFYRIVRTNWQDVVLRRHLTFYEMGVLVALLTFAEWSTMRLVHLEKGTPLTMTELARELAMDRKQLAKVVRSLEEKGALTEVAGAFVLNSQLCFYGKHLLNADDHVAFANGECGYTPAVEAKYRAKDE